MHQEYERQLARMHQERELRKQRKESTQSQDTWASQWVRLMKRVTDRVRRKPTARQRVTREAINPAIRP
ncbi:MAG: hypothetical protein R2932_43165 [Caldilineaceae bacterium]